MMGIITAAIAGKTLAAGVSIAFGVKANSMEKQEQRHAATLNGINNDISKYQAFANAAIESQELQDAFISQESSSKATAAAQGRRSSSGSTEAISTERKRMLDKNVARLDENAQLTGKALDLNTASGKRAAEAAGKAGDLQLGANIAGSVLKIII